MQKENVCKFSLRTGLATLLLGASLAVNAQDVVKGIVTDSTGEPVIGATIKVKGSEKTGTITAIDGDFSLAGVQKGQTLVISYIGFTPQEVKFNGKDIKVVLLEDSKALNEVVVVGYGSSKKRDLIASVSTVKAEDRKSVV